MIPKKPEHEYAPRTAREVLVAVMGKDHAEHSVAEKRTSRIRKIVEIECTCGARAEVAMTSEVALSLRNVVESIRRVS